MKIVKLSILLVAVSGFTAMAQTTKKTQDVPATVVTKSAETSKPVAVNNTYGLDDANYAIISKQVQSISALVNLSDEQNALLMTQLAPFQNRVAAISASRDTNPDFATQIDAINKMKTQLVMRFLNAEQIEKLGGEARLTSIMSSK